MADVAAGESVPGGARWPAGPGRRRPPGDSTTSRRRPRRRRHIAASAVVAGYLVAAAVVTIAHRAFPMPQWLALHLLLLGGATNAVFVWSRHFSEGLLHLRPRSHSAARIHLLVLNTGIVSVLVGVAGKRPVPAFTGAGLIIAAVLAHTGSLLALLRAARLPARLRVVVRFYVAGGLALAVGAGAGALLAGHAAHSDAWKQAAVLMHVHLNLLGWLGLSVIGTQLVLWPAILRTRMADNTPAVARATLIGAGAGLTVTVAALLLSPFAGWLHWLAALGMAAYAAAAVYALEPALLEMRARPPRTASAWALVAGNAWLIVALVADTVGLVRDPAEAEALLGRVLVPLLGIGVVAQILAGALGYLLPVTIGGGPAGNRVLTAILDYRWRTRAFVGNAGVVILAAAHGAAWHEAGWACVLAGFGTFPLLVFAALNATRKPVSSR